MIYKILTIYYMMLIYRCEDNCEEIHSIDETLRYCGCKCGKPMKLIKGIVKEREPIKRYESCSGTTRHRRV